MDWGFGGLFGVLGGYDTFGRRPNPWQSYQPHGTPYDEPRQYSPRQSGSGHQGRGGLVATIHSGAEYSISARELHILQSPMYGANLRPPPRPISMPDAANQLFAPHPIERTDAYEDAWDRVDEILDENISWDLIIKMFNDLDTIVFHGDLRHRVRVQWVDMRIVGEPSLAFTEPPANYNIGRITINMSTDTNWSELPEGQALGVLLHEMLHAYFMVWCRDDTVERFYEPGQDTSHGAIYMHCARRIERKIRVNMTSNESVEADCMGQGAHINYPTMQGAWSGGMTPGFGMAGIYGMFPPSMDLWGVPFFGRW